MTAEKEIELNGKHNGDEPIVCTIIISNIDPGFGGDMMDDGFGPSADFSVEGISDDVAELYKDEIADEVIYLLAEYTEDMGYVDPDHEIENEYDIEFRLGEW
jgi:hypothetical protein